MHDLAAGITDLVLAAVLLGCAAVLARTPGPRRSWSLAFASFGAAAVAGVAHHLLFAGSRLASDLSWLSVGILVAVAISALLAATAGELLSGPVARAVVALRTAGLAAYLLAVAIGGIGRTTPLVLSESVTMAAVVGLWVHGLRAGHPAAARMLVAIAVCALPSVLFAVPAATLTGAVGLDAAALQHLGQIPGVLLLCSAALACGPRRSAPVPA